MNKQIEVKNTETLTCYHKKRQGRDLRGGKGLPTRVGQTTKRAATSMGLVGHSRAHFLAHYLPRLPTPVSSTWAFK